MYRFFLFIIIVFIYSCAGVVDSGNVKTQKTYIPLQIGHNDTLISCIIDGIHFAKWQKQIIENALQVAKKNNITFDFAVVAEQFQKSKDKNVFKIYEDNQEIFGIIANGWNYKNPNDDKRTGEFYDITMKIPVSYDKQEEKIKNIKDVFEKNNLAGATKIFLVPWYAGDENTIKIAEKYGYKLIIQENIDKNNLIVNYNIIKASKCYVNVPGRVNINDRDIDYMKKRIQGFMDKNIKRIYIVFHPVNFNSPEAVFITERLINEISFKFKSATVVFGKVEDGG